ncbi:MAG: VIT domain-containing protein [Phycisphaerales bacterium]
MRVRPILLVCSAALSALAMVFAGCESSRTHSPARAESTGQNLPADYFDFERGGYVRSTTPAPGTGNRAQTALSGYDNAPGFDLDSVLQHGGDGGGRSPFVDNYYAPDYTQGVSVPGNGITGLDAITNAPVRATLLPDGVPVPTPMIATNLAPIVAALPGEEIWVIVQPDRLPPPMPYAAYTTDAPGCGALCYLEPGRPEPIPFPLEHTGVTGEINGYVASVSVNQRFHNPSSQVVEALYVFPLPHDAAVNGFLMTIGERTIRGIIRPREQAERIYEQARSQGHTASLLTQERANIFTQHVANIEPGRTVEIDITYFHTLAYVDGWFEYVFPMVVGPRFNPPSLGAYGRGENNPANPSNQPVATSYITPQDRSGHDISIDLTINAGVPIEQVGSRSHRIGVREETETTWRVRLDPDETIPNRDFVMRYRVAGDQVRGGIIVQRDPTNINADGWFTMLLVPPVDLQYLHRAPVEFVFVVDTSGSMNGQPLAIAQAAIDDALLRLVPGDTFQIIRFSENASTLGRGPLPATAENIRRGREYVAGLRSGGGTMMMHGIRAALDYPHDRNRQRYVVFLTDGFIGNENEILGAMHDRIGRSRVFSFGIGTSPNRALMDEMARVGRGAVAYLAPQDNGPAVMAAFFDRVSHPALTDVEIDFGGLRGVDVFPRQLPDLFVGRPVVITGRYTGNPDRLRSDPIVVRGMAGGQSLHERGEATRVPYEFRVGVHEVAGEFPAHERAEAIGQSRGIREVWARAMIRDLENEWRRTGRDRGRDIETVALRNNLMSVRTSLVAVDSFSRARGSTGVSVDVPSYTPAGMLGDGR